MSVYCRKDINVLNTHVGRYVEIDLLYQTMKLVMMETHYQGMDALQIVRKKLDGFVMVHHVSQFVGIQSLLEMRNVILFLKDVKIALWFQVGNVQTTNAD